MGNTNKTIVLTVDVQAKLTDMQNQVGKMEGMLKGLKMPDSLTASTKKDIDDLSARLKKVKEYTEGNKLNLVDEKKVQSEFNAIQKDYNRLIGRLNASSKHIKFGGNETTKALEKGIKAYEEGIKQTNDEYREQLDILHKLQEEEKNLRKIANNSSSYEKDAKARLKAEENALQKLKAERDKYIKDGLAGTLKQQQKKWSPAQAEANAQKKYGKLIEDQTKKISAAEQDLNKARQEHGKQAKEDEAAYKESSKMVAEQTRKVNELSTALENLKAEQLDKVKKDLSELGIDVESVNSVEDLRKKLDSLDDTDAEKVKEILKNVGLSASEGSRGVDDLRDSTSEAVTKFKELDDSIQSFKKNATYFFGLSNAFRLFRRGVSSAINTVKELDAVMTQTAVVTNFSVGDMWKQLPEYTKRANELGVSIHDVYESATLYYQQGLNDIEVTQLSTETLKMARIANLDAAEATSRMTNALRGFNMELNETNAQRVNDVYSKLAAITASDTNEISTAMTKVASLAHNANMEFETTSAFLAQMIETTRESAETAGTALKTVVARFSEVKKLYSQGDLMGTDEEGEQIDVNKVSQALRSAGINLNEYLAGAKGLDDIFIELASKWQSLDKIQQRYIATMAAGSRQQSRFIAMMSDYNRTVELVNAANTSAGASQKQFEKTLDSLQSKLAQLKNSWDTFLMGIADDKIIKTVVDGLTQLIGRLNDFFDATDKFTGNLGGAFTRIGSILLIFQASKTAVDKTAQSLSRLIQKKTEDAGATAVETAAQKAQNLEQAEAVPIIQAESAKVEENTQRKNRNTIATMASAKATGVLSKAATFATSGLGKLALAAGGVVTAVSLVGLAVQGITWAINKFKPKSLSDKLDEAKKSSEEAGKAAEDAANKYNDLKVAISSLDDSYKTIDSYVKGTADWYEQVKLLNAEVLKLMDAYDGLKVVNKDGVLTIENLDEVLDKYAKYSYNAQVGYIGSQTRVNELRKQMLAESGQQIGGRFVTYNAAKERYTNSLNAARNRGTSQGDYWDDANQIKDHQDYYIEELLNSGEIEKVALKLYEGDVERNAEAVNEYFKSVGQYTEVTKEDVDRLITLGKDLSELQAKQENNLNSFKSYAVMGANVKEGTETEVANFLTDAQISQVIADAERRNSGLLKTELKKKILDNSQYDTVEDYKKATDIDLDDLDKEELVDMASWQDALKDSEEVINAFSEGLKDLPDEIKKIYSREDRVVFSDEELERIASSFSLEEAEKRKANGESGEEITKELREIAESYWNGEENKNTRAAYSNDFEKFFADLSLSIVKSSKASRDIDQKYENVGITNIDDLKGFSAGVKQDLYNDLLGVFEKSGEEGSQIIFEDILDIIKDLSPEQAEEFLRLLTSGDWESLNVLENIPGLMEQIGAYGINIDILTQHMEKYNEAIKKVDTESLIKQFSDLTKFGAGIKNGEQGRTGISEDIYNRLIESNEVKKSDFIKDVNGTYTYKGESLDDIIKAIEDLGNQIKVDLQPLQRSGTTIDSLIANNDIVGVQERAINSGMSDELRNQYMNDLPNLGALTKVFEEAEDLELDTGELEKYIQTLKKLGKTLSGVEVELSDVTAASVALKNVNLNAGLRKLINSYEEWTELLKDGEKAFDDFTFEDQKVWAGYADAVRQMLNADVSDEFLKLSENIDLVTKAAEGSTDALYELQTAAAIDQFGKIDLSVDVDKSEAERALDDMINWYSQNAPSLTVGTQIDTGPFMKGLNYLLEQAGVAAESIQKVLSSMDLSMETETYTAMVPVEGGRGFKYVTKTRAKSVTSGGGISKGTKFASPKSSGGGGSSGSEKNDTWENPYDELYNLTERINEALRERERLERVYQKTVKKTESTVGAVSKAYYDQIKQLRYEADLQKQMQEGRARQIAKVGSEMYTDSEGNRSSFSSLGVTKYANYNTSTGLLQIDWSGLEALEGNPNKVEEGKAAEAYISRLEELQEQFEEVRDKLWDIEDQIEELREEAIENYLTFEDRVMDALVNSYQKEIDEASALFDMIKENTDAVIKGIQEDVALSRQIRDNTKKEEDIADKEARLAYLRRDTSGANALEIKKLEEEISNARESYSDSLVDQQITQLQDTADKAAEQRQHQIELMQHQLDIAKENGTLWGEVWDLLNTATAGDGTFSQNSELVMLLEDMEAYQSLSAIGQKKWWEETAEAFKEAMVGLKESEDKYKTDANGDGKVTSSGTSSAISTVSSMSSSTPSSSVGSAPVSSATSASTNATGGHFLKVGEYKHPKAEMPAAEVKELQQALNAAGFTDNSGNALAVDGKYGSKTMAAVTKLQAVVGTRQDGYYGPDTRKATLASKYKAYKTGGIADFTGPAWLDGSKAHPELVLNAKDTQNFIALKDTLAGLLNGQNGDANGLGGTTYVNVSIDAEIGSDYDVSQLAAQVKKEIYNDSAYRNVNTINLMR